jgi:hypothetical protein
MRTILSILTLIMLVAGIGEAADQPLADQAAFCSVVAGDRARLKALGPGPTRDTAVKAAGAEIDLWVKTHRSINWVGTVGRITPSQGGRLAGEVEVCPSVWVGGLTPDNILDSETWAEPETHVFNQLHRLKTGDRAEVRGILYGAWIDRPDFPDKIWVRAKIVGIEPPD